jgi:hypothetical protein
MIRMERARVCAAPIMVAQRKACLDAQRLGVDRRPPVVTASVISSNMARSASEA